MTPTPHPSPGQTAPATRPRRAGRTSTLVLSILGVGLLCLLTVSIFKNVVIFDIGHRNNGERETAARFAVGFLKIESYRDSGPNEAMSCNRLTIPMVFYLWRIQNSSMLIDIRSMPPYETGWTCVINLWLVALALLVVPGLRLRTARRRAKRRSKGLCEDCGYDLRGGTGDTCPECGQIVEAADEGHVMVQDR